MLLRSLHHLQPRLLVLSLVLGAHRRSVHESELAFRVRADTIESLLAAQGQHRICKHKESPFGVAQRGLHRLELPLLNIVPPAGRVANAHAACAMGEVDESQLRVADDRCGLAGGKRCGEELRADTCKPIKAHALVVEKEEFRRLGRWWQRKRAIACGMDLALELLKR